MLIRFVPLGKKINIIIDGHPVIATVISIYNQGGQISTCLGFVNPMKPFDLFSIEQFLAAEQCIDNVKEYYTHYRWVHDPETECFLLYDYPDQKCRICLLPAPHAEPNEPDKTYMCSGCRIIQEL